jgi:trehalose 6-phosphate synthase
MRITLRLIISLGVAVAVVTSFFAYTQVRQERGRLVRDLERRSQLLAESLQEAVEPLLAAADKDNCQRLVDRFSGRERVEGLAVYDWSGAPVAASSRLAEGAPTGSKLLGDVLQTGVAAGEFESLGGRSLHAYAQPLAGAAGPVGVLVVFHDASHIRARLALVWRQNFFRLLVQMVMISLVTLLVLRWSVMGPIGRMADWMKRLRAGEDVEPIRLPKEDLFAPIAREVTTFAKHLTEAKAAAEEEARLRQTSESLWTAEKLKEFVRNKLQGRPLLVVSNREPYMHIYKGRKIDCLVPAGGLVTALDPVLRATDGLWIAHGSGDADADTSDASGRLRVPPEDPRYTLQRVTLTKEEEKGYYYGFANEGLWPLCHIVHARPTFRAEDWAQYQRVNEKFAESVLSSIEGMEEPCVLVQDYHFALLPRLVKDRRPDARIALFWHIPWPNPEAFGICPWQKEILYGMLGADIVGFHIQFHCNNFLDTVDRALESRIDWERPAVVKGGHSTQVRRYPISVAFSADAEPEGPEKSALLKELGVKAEFMALGVDRVDYTKGIPERFRAVERFLEKYPAYVGRFTLVQLGAPSRTTIKRYHDFLAEVEEEAERINWKFKTKGWKPIVFLNRHHEPREVKPYYRRADVCLVTSLHDGMNLVAKEFVSARADGDGVLVVSRFAGASRELRDALIVNPYDVDQTAEAIRRAVEMPAEERTERMRRMRETVREFNIFRWAGNLIVDLTNVPSPRPAAPPS